MPHRGLTFSSGYHAVEESVFANLTSFKDRLDLIMVMPITSEADLRLVRCEYEKLLPEMQMFSKNTLTEGHQRGSNPGYPGLSFGTHDVEGPKAATA